MLKKGSAAAKAFMAKLRAAKGKKKPIRKISGPHDATIDALKDKLNFYEWNLKEFNKYLITAVKNKKTAEAKKIREEIERLENTIKGKKKDIETLQKPLIKKPSTKKPRKTGASNVEYDKRHQALPPGKKISKKTGKPYYEYRENRTDKGKLLGIAGIQKKSIDRIKENLELIDSLKNRQIPEMQQQANILKGTDKTKKIASINNAKDFLATLKKQNTMLKKHI